MYFLLKKQQSRKSVISHHRVRNWFPDSFSFRHFSCSILYLLLLFLSLNLLYFFPQKRLYPISIHSPAASTIKKHFGKTRARNIPAPSQNSKNPSKQHTTLRSFMVYFTICKKPSWMYFTTVFYLFYSSFVLSFSSFLSAEETISFTKLSTESSFSFSFDSFFSPIN